ncbi:MAG: YcxB family protein [Proteobacteria bacterium]|nr:YcxB family protein [Pseudomonadota bacterium]
MPNAVTFVLSEAEFVEGVMITKRWTARRWLLVAVFPTLIYLAIGLYMAQSADLRPVGFGIIAFVPVLWTFGFFAQLYLLPYRARRMFKLRKHLSTEVSWDADGFRVTTERGSGIAPWSEVPKWREGTGVILLSLTPPLYINVPKRAFQDRGLADFIDCLEQRVSTEAASG